MEERLQKILSGYGEASRRAAERMIQDGRVLVNGETAKLGERADPERDEICLDGRKLGEKPKALYLMLNKPRGFVTTLSDEQGRKTVAELVEDCGQRVYPVGRLDLYSEGLLILTNDGDAAYRLSHPKHDVSRTYLVWASGWQENAVNALMEPIQLDGVTIRAVRVGILQRDSKNLLLRMTIREGRNRQIRRMCDHAGLTVTRLKRVKEGALQLGNLKTGRWRPLTDEEIGYLKSL